jgi:hypothetical protein
MNTRYFYLSMTLIIFLLLQGCATLSREQCLLNDWDSIGFRDGSQGYPFDRIHAHTEACESYQIEPHIPSYIGGRERGLQQIYCTEEMGFQEGDKGEAYQNVCSDEGESAFMRGYLAGLDSVRNRLEADLRDKSAEVYRKTSEVARIDNEKERKRQLEVLDRMQDELEHLETRRKDVIQLLDRAYRLY